MKIKYDGIKINIAGREIQSDGIIIYLA